MKKKKAVSIAVAAVFVVIILSLGISVGVRISKNQSLHSNYKADWNIELPDMKEIYRNTDLGFTGDGSRYLIFQTKEVSNEFLAGLSEGRNEDFENRVNKITSERLQVPENKLPNWEEAYDWKIVEKENSSDYLCIIYYPETKQLVLASVEI